MKITNVILLEVIVEGDKMNEVLLDTLIDTLKLIPFLFLAFLLIEYMEHKLSKKSRNAISKAGRFGPFERVDNTPFRNELFRNVDSQ